MEAMVTVLGGLATIIVISIRVERIFLRREQDRLTPEPKQKPWTEPARPPQTATLETGEQAALAAFAVRYAHGDNAAGVRLADYMRIKHPGVSDTEIARMLIGLHHVGRSFGRTQADPLAAYLHAMGSAALHLTELERSDIPS